MNNKYIPRVKKKMYIILNYAKRPLAYKRLSEASKIEATSTGRVKQTNKNYRGRRRIDGFL
jgi:hypothetical protein